MSSLDLSRAEWEGVASDLEGLVLSVGLRMGLLGIFGKKWLGTQKLVRGIRQNVKIAMDDHHFALKDN
jgi:hypothetical protein